MATQPPGILHTIATTNSASSWQDAAPGSPAWSVYVTPGPAEEAAGRQVTAARGETAGTAGAGAVTQKVASKAVQTSPPEQLCAGSSNSSRPGMSWWWGRQDPPPQHQAACTQGSPGSKVRPRVLFVADGAAGGASPVPDNQQPALSMADGQDGVPPSPANFPFGCRSSQDTAGDVQARSISPSSSDDSDSLVQGTDSDSDAEQDEDSSLQPAPARTPAASALWSVHNNALAWTIEGDAATGMRSMEDALSQPTAAQATRQPLQPALTPTNQQQQQQRPHFTPGIVADSICNVENMDPAAALAAYAQLAQKLKSRMDEAAGAIAPVVSKADVGLVVLASPLAGSCGRWQRGSCGSGLEG